MIVDPIMADNGELYKGFDDHYISNCVLSVKSRFDFAQLTQKLVFLADLPYQDNDLTEQF